MKQLPCALLLIGVLGFSTTLSAQNPSALDAPDGSPTEAVSVDNTGKVGVGTTQPVRSLHVAGGALLSSSETDATTKSLLLEGRHYTNAEGTVLYLWGLSLSNETLFRFGSGHSTFRSPTKLQFYTAPTNTSSGQLRMTVNSAGKVGIGTGNPAEMLSVNGTVQSTTGGFKFPDGTLQTTAAGPRNTLDAADGSPTSAVFVDNAGNVGIGTTTPSALLAVNGTIRAREVVVTASGWPDFVFEDDYVLMPLAEIEAAIQRQRHLPGIPSAAEVEEQGIGVGAMQAKLLQKVEELTLHMIELDKENKVLQAELAALREQR